MNDFDDTPTSIVGDPADDEPTRTLDPSRESSADDLELEEDDETVVSFPPIDMPPSPVAAPPVSAPSRPRLPSFRPPRVGTGPARALTEERLFGDLEPELRDTPPPPPLVVPPRKRPGREQLRASARRATSVELPHVLPLTVAFLSGAVVASLVFLMVGHLQGSSHSSVAVERPRAAKTRPAKSVADRSPRPRPAATPRPRAGVASSAATVPEQPAAPPATAPTDPNAPPATHTDPPAVAAGKRLARALTPCRLKHGGESLRLAVYLAPPGKVRRVFMARRSWLNRRGRECVRRELVGMELPGFRERGFVEWQLWLAPDAVNAMLLRQRPR